MKKISDLLKEGQLSQPMAERLKLESPLELNFIENLEKYLSPKVELSTQFQVFTRAGNFRLDFMLSDGKSKIGIECDGKDYHDEWRDALILGDRQLDTIYRFRGKDIHCFLDDCIYFIYHYDKNLFDERYKLIANRLISESLLELLDYDPNFYMETNILYYWEDKNDESNTNCKKLKIERRNSLSIGHWRVLYNFAQNNPDKDIDQLIKMKEEEMRNNS